MERILCFGVVYVVEAVIAWLYFDYLYTIRRPSWQIALSVLLGYCVLFALSSLESVLLNVLAFFTVNLIILWFNYYCSFKAALLHSCVLCCIMNLTEVVIIILLNWFVDFPYAFLNNLSIVVTFGALSKLLYLLFAFICARIFRPQEQNRAEPKMLLFVCTLPLLSMAVTVALIYIYMTMELSSSTEIVIVITTLTLMLLNVVFFFLYSYLQKANQSQLAWQLRTQKEEADTAYYQALQSQADAQRILIHNIKSHLRTIEDMAQYGKSDEICLYLSHMETSLKAVQRAKLCTDPILNAILLHTADQCRSTGIDLQCDIHEGCLTFLEPPAVTALFGNLLSNALEAAACSEEKAIRLSIIQKEEQDVTVISVVNSCGTPPTPDGHGFFSTTKQDAAMHGVGIRSIEQVVRKHRGSSTKFYDQEQKRFHYIVQFDTSKNK